MSIPKLTYFDVPGSRGEECRMALFLAGVEFEDVRVPFAQWREVKPTTPWGSVPTLEVAGKGTLAQTNAILSWIGREHGLLPTDAWQAARHEEVMHAIEDVRTAIGATMRLSTDEEKRAARLHLAETTIPTFAANLERQLERQSDGPFVGGEAISVADLKVYMMVRWIRSGLLDHMPTGLFDAHTRIMGCHDAVAADARVIAWYDR